MYDFSKVLVENEEILYQGRPTLGKGSKKIGGLLFLILFSLFVIAIMIWSVCTKTGDGENGINIAFILIFLVCLLFIAIGIQNIIYRLFLRDKKIAGDHYCVTNQRALKYRESTDELEYGYIKNYEEISAEDINGDYGKVIMSVVYDENVDIQTLMQKQDPNNMRQMVFESIENPKKIARIIKDAREKLKD